MYAPPSTHLPRILVCPLSRPIRPFAGLLTTVVTPKQSYWYDSSSLLPPCALQLFLQDDRRQERRGGRKSILRPYHCTQKTQSIAEDSSIDYELTIVECRVGIDDLILKNTISKSFAAGQQGSDAPKVEGATLQSSSRR